MCVCVRVTGEASVSIYMQPACKVLSGESGVIWVKS